MKAQNVRVAIAQINCTVGDLEGNCAKIQDTITRASAAGAEIVCFPELAICGYPPEDLLLKPKFIQDNLARLKKIAAGTHDIIAVVGFVDKKGRDIYNAAAVIYNGKIKGVHHKSLLPNYGVFDEKRYFKPGDKPSVFRYGEILFGVAICEDVWSKGGVVRQQVAQGARLILVINASPYHVGKIREREAVITRQARNNRAAIVYTNLVGGQDEIVFDGQSMVVDARGKVVARGQGFKEDLAIVDLAIPLRSAKTKKTPVTIADKVPLKEKKPLSRTSIAFLEPASEVYQALMLGLFDYVKKNGFQKAVLGLSGGIDSALVAAIAADALGSQNVTCVFMPSHYSSEESKNDATEVARNLGIELFTIWIEEPYKAYLGILAAHFAGLKENIAEENLQARIRGNILMALSNKFNWLVLTTGNKSEMSTGYATLYGDMAGGFAVIKDVPKVLVYELARYRNSLGTVIPENIFVKAPTAELKPNQKDSDTLPVYEALDPILKAYVEEDKDLDSIVAKGFDRDTVKKVMRMVDTSEYKRRQAPPGVKITPKAFGRDRRMPITNKYKG